MTYWGYGDNCRTPRHSTRHNNDVGLLVSIATWNIPVSVNSNLEHTRLPRFLSAELVGKSEAHLRGWGCLVPCSLSGSHAPRRL